MSHLRLPPYGGRIRAGGAQRPPTPVNLLTGTARSALEAGPRRNHFLAVAEPEYMEALKRKDSALFKGASYGAGDSLMMNYWPSAAWAWSVCDKEQPGMILYTDI
ncbi:hypothetical protein IMZ48_45975 [Candidatus Bathyarchaeota archaeon]|nr:hypothetical protein [Candidatus Bathyarchaeota archaeon]